MIRTLKAESLKLKRRYVYLMFAVSFFVIVLWTCYSLNDLDFNKLSGVFAMTNTNLLLINTIISPVIIAALASRLADIELMGNTYKWLSCMQNTKSIFKGKIALGLICLFFYSLAQSIFYILIGIKMDFYSATKFLLFFISVFAVMTALFIFQLNFSLWSKNQLTPLFISIGGTFAGLFSWFLPQYPLRFIIPWGYFCVLCNNGINYDSVSRYTEYYWTNYPYLWLIVLIIYIVLQYMYTCREFISEIKEI